MKSFIKNNLKIFVTVIISGIIFGGIGVYAASQYFAKDITFTPTNENFKKENGEPIDNVEDALNELYSKSDTEIKIINKLPQTTFGTNGTQNYSITLDGLTIGKKYLLFVKNGINANQTNFTVKNVLSTQGTLINKIQDYNSVKTVNGNYPGWNIEIYVIKADSTSITDNVSLTNSVNGWVYLQAFEIE